MFTMKPLLILPCLILLLLNAVHVFPLCANTRKQSKPVVLIISQSQKEPEKTRERRFITQTMLALEQFRIVTIDSHQHDFSMMPFSKRLEVIRPLAKKHNAAATLWVEETKENRTLLHLVAFSTGRALVRIVEAQTGPDAALELALAAQELLGQAYLLSEKRDEAIETVVTQLTKDVVSTLKAPKIAAASEEKSFPLYSLGSFAASKGGISDYAGNPLAFGGGLALELWPIDHLRVRTTVLFLAGLHRADEYGTVYPFGLDIELGIGYLFPIKRFFFGPVIAVSALWNKLNVSLKTTGNHVFNWWGASISAALDMRFSISDKLSLLLEPGVAVLPRNKQFYLRPEQETIFMTARVSWCIKLGFIVFLKKN
jgi:hypothetical protein